jgi:hypothetical protein
MLNLNLLLLGVDRIQFWSYHLCELLSTSYEWFLLVRWAYVIDCRSSHSAADNRSQLDLLLASAITLAHLKLWQANLGKILVL